jgi:hypothetical protein
VVKVQQKVKSGKLTWDNGQRELRAALRVVSGKLTVGNWKREMCSGKLTEEFPNSQEKFHDGLN